VAALTLLDVTLLHSIPCTVKLGSDPADVEFLADSRDAFVDGMGSEKIFVTHMNRLDATHTAVV
jgi:hypothetical protein